MRAYYHYSRKKISEENQIEWQDVVDMNICLDKSTGSIIASDESLGTKYIKCDGRRVWRNDYPALFKALRVNGDSTLLPDYRYLLMGVQFYIIAE